MLFCWISLLFIQCTDDSINPDEEEEVVPVEAFKVAKLNIVTENASEISSKEIYINCSLEIKSERKEWNYSGTGQIRGRGNSTWHWYPKKPYRIKLNEKSKILGLKSNRDWVLLADYRDPTHLMNTFVFTMGQGLQIPYTNHSRYVEINLNGDYVGLYCLTEQVEQGKNRVAIDSTSGILLSLDVDDGPKRTPNVNNNFWSSVYNMPVCVKSPEISNPGQLITIKQEFEQLEEAIKSAEYSAVDELFNIPVFIDFMIIQELAYNVEVDAPRSMYLYKDIDGLWTMGPLWDFDAGYDFDWSTMYTGHNYFSNYKQLVLGTAPVKHTGGYRVPNFFTDFFNNKQFTEEYKARWLEIKPSIMTEHWPITNSYAVNFSDAMIRDADRWPIDKDHSEEIQNMQRWLTNRIDYLSSVIENYPTGSK